MTPTSPTIDPSPIQEYLTEEIRALLNNVLLPLQKERDQLADLLEQARRDILLICAQHGIEKPSLKHTERWRLERLNGYDSLNSSELAVLSCLASGYTIKETAAELGMPHQSVKNLRHTVYTTLKLAPKQLLALLLAGTILTNGEKAA